MKVEQIHSGSRGGCIEERGSPVKETPFVRFIHFFQEKIATVTGEEGNAYLSWHS
jgi:hypothetical protein